MFDQRGELPLLPFGNPIGFVPASRGGIYIESTARPNVPFRLNVHVDPPKGSPSLSISPTHPMASMTQEQLTSPSPSATYRRLIQQVIYETAERGNVVIVAHAAGFHLAGMKGLLRVFVTASTDVRVERLRQVTKIDAQDARKAIEKDDNERQAYLRRFYDIRQDLPTHYDLVVNTDVITTSVATRLIVSAAKS